MPQTHSRASHGVAAPDRSAAYRKSLAAATSVVVAASVVLAATPAAAAGFDRDPQSYPSTPVESVSGAPSAFQDAAANWTGEPADSVGGADSGDWTATDLSPTGAWSHGGSSGAFSYSYGLRVPPAAGPVPELALSYSSATHDGRTSGSNNQASWIGDGWSYTPGFVERSYVGCADDEGGNQGDDPTGDLCWDGDSPAVTISLAGVTTALVRDDDSGRWRAEEDADWRIAHSGAPAGPGTASTERWTVTTTDGTVHHFAAEAGSRWTVPVFGNHSGEACHSSGDFAGSRCDQAYRWMLDRSVDVHGNLVRYTYGTATGRYAPAVDPARTATYVREGWLERIDYGLRTDAAGVVTGRVEFTVADRCLSSCRDSDGDPVEDNWPDTPWDLGCAAGQTCTQYSPAFFGTKRLTTVTTRVAAGSGFSPVDSWALTHEFKDYGDEEQVVLWLASVRHTGHVGGTASTPPVEFGGTFLPNRVDAGEAFPNIWRPRLTSIRNETGGVTTVNYSEPDCGAGDLPASRHQNGRLCYPVRHTPDGLSEPVDVYFHKYVVRSVAESDATGGGETMWTFYDYSTDGGGTSVLWAWDDAEYVADDDRTWSQWRGYPEVVTRVGDPADPGPQLRTRTRYYRGLHGDRLPDGGSRQVTLRDSGGNTVTDHRALAGAEWESASFDDTTLIESATTWYWTSRTARRGYDGGTLEAWLTGQSRVDTRTRLSGSAWRTTRTETGYDAHGRAVSLHEHGDVAVGGDERCVRTTYADNAGAWLLESVATVGAVSVGCTTTPQRPAQVIGAVRAYYDGHASYTAAPSRGLMTRAEALDSWTGTPEYRTTGESTYDNLGRPLTAADALGRTTTTAYTPAGGGPLTRTTTTNPAGQVTRTSLAPAWGVTVETVAPGDRRTVVAHDALGRRTGVWLPGRDPATQGPNSRFGYGVSATAPSTVTTENMIQDGSYLRSVALYDSLLRPRQTQAQTYGGRLVSQTVYDSYGRTRHDSGPVFNNASGPTGTLVWISRTNDVSRTEYAYDGAGRVSSEIFVVKDRERWRTSYRYGGHDTHWMTTTIAPQGGTSRATLDDARGRTVELRQYRDRDATGAFDATRFTYTPGGQRATVTDPVGNVWRYEYDLRGRQTVSRDPDTGTTTTAYDAAGQLAASTDGRGTRLSYAYDLLGRTTKVWEGEAGDGTLLVERTYDGATNGTGLPHTATRWVDGQAWRTEIRAYTPEGRPQQVYTHLPAAAGALAGAYWESYTYHPDGSLRTSGAVGAGGLAREPMTHHYNTMGQPDRVTSSGDDFGDGHVYVDAAVYSPYGQLLQRRLGDPEVGGSSGQAWQTWVYEEGTGRLADFYFDKDTAGESDGANHGVAALSYRYDQAGNVLSITDDPVHTSAALDPETQCFRYDHLQRLTEAWAQAGAGSCAATPTGTVVGGPGAYWSSYEYDTVGNRTAETRWRPTGRVRHDYAYPAAGQPRPHTVTAVTTNADGGARTAFGYDQAGFTTTIDRNGTVDVLDWAPTGRLETVTSGEEATTFVDDADGRRILRIDPDGDMTAWVAGYELTYDAATRTVRASRYYRHGDDPVGVRTGRGDIQWFASDHHGTNQWVVNGDTLTTQVRRFDPFGNVRGWAPSTWPDQRAFVGGIENPDLGLTSVGAREYDPATGRFLSRDPIADFADPQQINGYAYANNTPVSASDASGLKSVRKAGNRAGTPGKKKLPKKPKSVGVGRSTGVRGQDGAAGSGNGGAGRSGEQKKRHAPKNGRQHPGGVGVPSGSAPGNLWEAYEESYWNAWDLAWDGLGEACPRGPLTAVACNWVQSRPPGGGGWCVSAGANARVSYGVSGCAVLTREDGLVFTGAHQGGMSAGVGASVNTGPVLTSSSNAQALGGRGWGADYSYGEIFQYGAGGTISETGDWTVNPHAGVGVGACAAGGACNFTVFEEQATAVTWDEVRDAAETWVDYGGLDVLWGWQGL
ncbi:RHS repeat-associated core domain-containing protein [Plantactinospora sp. B5E13]|uniref:RHS repeat domain-containing protein n=1 Tax=Plantactinospora sp. B5E13 TaxID=3153758 RepID=UPI00325E8ACE